MQTYTIPEASRQDVEKLIARYQRKAAAYGVTFAAECGKPYAREVPVRRADPDTRTIETVGSMAVECFDLTISGDQIKMGDYAVVAKLEHLDGGNVVTLFGGEEMRPEWATMPARCDHCGTAHRRTVTYLVRENTSHISQSSHISQVGRACLKDYCGINPQGIGLSFALWEIIEGMDIYHYDFPAGGGACRAYNVEDALALAAMIQRTQGYTPSDRPGSNKAMLCDALRGNKAATDADRAKAAEIIQATKAMSDRDAVDACLVNVQTLIASGYCKLSHMGYIAYAPLAYERYQEKQAAKAIRDAETAAARQSSRHVGEVGQRLVIDVAQMDLITSWEGQFGWTYLYKITDQQGNVFIWYASRTIAENAKKIKATVKDHTERDGVKQTVITRCVAA